MNKSRTWGSTIMHTHSFSGFQLLLGASEDLSCSIGGLSEDGVVVWRWPFGSEVELEAGEPVPCWRLVNGRQAVAHRPARRLPRLSSCRQPPGLCERNRPARSRNQDNARSGGQRMSAVEVEGEEDAGCWRRRARAG